MRICAYVLVADPAWATVSMRSYYSLVDEIVLSYDENYKGWTGAPVQTEETLSKLLKCDSRNKMRRHPGRYFHQGRPPMENETRQRRVALKESGSKADWVLTLDTDEFLPDPQIFVQALEMADSLAIPSVEWPMRVLFQQLSPKEYLEVCQKDGSDHYEYPGATAVKPDVELREARHTVGTFLRYVVKGDQRSLQITRPKQPGETRLELPLAHQAIIHNSWARDPANILRKQASWGHHQDMRNWQLYYLKWRSAPLIWRYMRNLHPLNPELWPALRACEIPPADLSVEEGEEAP